jgi:hypothetical protein
MSGLVGHAREELRRLGLIGAGAPAADRLLATVAIMWCENVDRYGLAPDRAGAIADMMSRLVRLEPLSPLTGAADEWAEVGPGVWQNRRCVRVFRNEQGEAYDIASFAGTAQVAPLTFPYWPESHIPPRSSEITAELQLEERLPGARVDRFPVPGDVLLPGRDR